MSFPRFPRGATIITPSDTTDLTGTGMSIVAYGTGNLVVRSASIPETLTIPVNGKELLNFQVSRVMAATTVGLLVIGLSG